LPSTSSPTHGAKAEQHNATRAPDVPGTHLDRRLTDGPAVSAVAIACVCGRFLSLFTSSLPLEPMLRVWDCFFHEGVKALQRVAMGLLWLRQDEILCLTDQLEVFELLR